MNRELIKELPEIFEEFNDQRKKSFVTAMEMKQKGVPFVGVFCTYLPQEIPMAMGAAVVGLCSTSGETIPEAEKDLPRNLCPLVKSSYGFAKTDKCPYFYFSDLIVGETTSEMVTPKWLSSFSLNLITSFFQSSKASGPWLLGSSMT